MACRQRPSTNLPGRVKESTHSWKVVAGRPPSVRSVPAASGCQALRYASRNCWEDTCAWMT
eukprot:4849582-Alexandrium_andersonii.AAC.1